MQGDYRDKSRLWVWIPRTGGTSLHTRLASGTMDVLIRDEHGLKKPILTYYRTANHGAFYSIHHHQPRALVAASKVARQWCAATITRRWCDERRPFIVIRNPWDRLASVWRHLRERCDWPDFSEFICRVAHHKLRNATRFDFTRPQHEWWRWPDGSDVGEVLRLEHLDDDLPDDLHFLRGLGHLNRSGGDAPQYDPDTAALVAEHDAATIERGGYQPPKVKG